MAKYTRTPPPKSRRKSPLPLFITGAGLIILAVAFSILARPSTNPADTPTQASGSSVVPSPVNYNAPALSLTSLDGQAVALEDYRGQVILVNNWATWCPPCRAEMPELESFFRMHQQDGFTLIGISAGDTQEQVDAFVNDYGVTFPMWLDPTEKAMRAFQTEYLPSSFVIDRDGIVRLAWTGAISLEMLEAHVAPLLFE